MFRIFSSPSYYFCGSSCKNFATAVRNGNMEHIQILVEGLDGLENRLCKFDSYFFLRDALNCRQKDIAIYLLSKGARVNVGDPSSKRPEVKSKWQRKSTLKVERTPLHLAVHLCDEEIMELLLQKGAWTDKLAGDALNTPLGDAVQYNKMKMIEILLKNGADVNTPGFDGKTPVMIAAGKRGVAVTKLLLDHGADPNSGLESAAEGGKVEIVKLLLNKGADINKTSKDTRSTLPHIAAGNRHGQLLDFLLKRGADVNAVDLFQKSVLETAVETGCPVIVNIVLSHHPDAKKAANKNVMHSALRCQHRTDVPHERHAYGEIIQSLLSYGFTIDDQDSSDPKSLFVAIRSGHAKIVAELIKRGSNREKLRNSILSELLPLYPSTLSNTTKLTNILIKYGADENARCTMGLLPPKRSLFRTLDLDIFKLLLTDRAAVKGDPDLLRLAVWHGHLEIAKCLLRHDAEVNAQDECGRAALHFCVFRPKNPLCPISQRTRSSVSVDIAVAKELAARGADLNVRTKTGETPLHIAAQNDVVELALVLVELGADVNATDDRGWTALHHCVGMSNLKLSEYLLSRGAEVNAKTEEDLLTALHIACDRGRLDLVQSLLQYGADVDSICLCGGTPLHLACAEGRNDVVKFLMEYGADVNVPDRNGQLAVVSAEGCSDFFFSGPSRDFLKSLIFCHFLKMDQANMFLCKKNIEFIKSRLSKKIVSGSGQGHIVPATYCKQCEVEVVNLKSEKLGNSNFSCYDVLVGSTSRLVKLSANENLRAIVNSDEFEQSYPLYASILRRRYQKGKWMRELWETCSEALQNILPLLPHLCVERVLAHLSIFDMRRLERALKATSTEVALRS